MDITELEQKAEQGDPEAQYQLGIAYYYSIGVEQDYTKTIEWFIKAAEQGYALAQYSLGKRYDNGEGMPEDYTKAFAWFTKAANQGFAQAQGNLGNMYHEGRGVEQDDNKAVEWFAKAAKQGYRPAQYWLGKITKLTHKGDQSMSSYQEKQEQRRKRYLGLAEKAEQASHDAWERGRDIGGMIPFGQPVLTDHYSARRHRNDLDKMHRLADKSVSESKKADYYRDKAAAVGTGGISGDDETALDQLKEELEYLQSLQNLMKEGNKIIRQAQGVSCRAALLEMGIPENRIHLENYRDRENALVYPFTFQLKNNLAKIKTVQARISTLEQIAQLEDRRIEGKGYCYHRDVGENRLKFIFDGKPSEEIRQKLKRCGFKWSPSRNAWVRQITRNAMPRAREVLRFLDSL